MDLALRFLKLNYEECLRGATIAPARALDRNHLIGSIEKGKQADILLIDAPRVEDFLHQIGDRRIEYVIKKGKIVHSRNPLLQT